ncbi:hypothetical protein ACHAQH_004793 [Verticillium albo-atrum]
MAWRSSGDTNQALAENLWRNSLIKDQRVKDAFLKVWPFSHSHASQLTCQVDRAHYAPRAPYADHPQSIGHGATISAPHMHAIAAESLLGFIAPSERNPAPRVLDIGSGSGYLTHLLAELVGENGMVVGVEHIDELRRLGEGNMAKSEEGRRLLETGRVKFRTGDGRAGWTEDGAEGWDAIHVGAAAIELHQTLVDQLRSPGRLFIPVEDEGGSGNQYIWTIDKKEDGTVVKEKKFGVRYVPLTDAPGR